MSELRLVSALEERMPAPTARGLAAAVSAAVGDGVLTDGDLLPPIRTVATELALSPTTVSSAWAMLRRAGTLVTDGRRGSRIARPAAGPSRYRAALERSVGHADGDGMTMDLSTGTPDPALLPDLAAALGAIEPPAEPTSYLADPVLPELAALLHDDWPFRAERITIVDGAMDALMLTARCHLRFGDVVAVEQPCFPPLLDLLEATGATPVPVALDDDGPLPEALAGAVAAGARALLFQPRGQNPSGACLTPARAAVLAEILAGAGTLIIEDDAVGAISTAPALSLGTHLPDRTIHIRSFSKSYGPDLRLAAVGGPAELLDPLVDLRFLGQGWTSRLLQRILVTMLTDPSTGDRMERARSEYAARRRAVVDRLATHGIDVPGSDGINIWLPVRDETAALLLLSRHGIAALPGAAFMIGRAAPHLRITTGNIRADHAAVADLLARAATVGALTAAR